VNHEEGQCSDQQQVHKQPDKIQGRIQLAVVGVGMRLVLDKALVGTLMTLAAGLDQILLVDRRVGIRGGQNLVRSVTIPATRRLHIAAQRSQLRVEGVLIGGKLVLVAGAADWRGLHTERGFRRLQNGVSRVAIRTDRSLHVASGDGLAVHSALVFRVNAGVAASACFWNIGLEGGAERVFMAKDVVRLMAALAIGRHQQTLFADRVTVNRVHVERIDVRHAELFGLVRIAVTGAAGARDVQRIDGRALVILGKNFVGVAVATGAGLIGGLGVDAVANLRLLIGMAGAALHGRNVVRMGIAFDVRVAIRALLAAMDAVAKLLAVHGDAVPVGVLHVFVRVTGQAILSRWLLGGKGR